MSKWGLRFLSACVVVFLPLALVFVGGFPMREGVVLGLLMAALGFAIAKAAGKPVCRFVPYWVRVTPDWYQILTDFKLISSPEEWRSIQESVRSSTGYRVLRDGVLFTVVQQSEDFEHTLIFWNPNQAFGSEFSFSEDMTPIQFERADDPSGWHPPARFFMKPYGAREVAGYGLGIEVRNWWWEKMKASCATPLGVESDPITGSVYLALATLPLKEFDVYRDPADRWTDEYISKTEPQIRKRRDGARQELGWTAEKREADDFRPYGGWPASITHKYFNIRHHAI